MHDKDVHKITFRTHVDHYEFIAMPFGQSNARQLFKRQRTNFLNPFYVNLSLFSLTTFYSSLLDIHLHHLALVLSTLAKEKLYSKFSKWLFAQKTIEYLRPLIPSSVAPDKSKVELILKWPLPSWIRQLRGFLGLAGFYCK